MRRSWPNSLVRRPPWLHAYSVKNKQTNLSRRYQCSKLYLLCFECAQWNSNFEWPLVNRQHASNLEEARDAADDFQAQKVAPPKSGYNPADHQPFSQVRHKRGKTFKNFSTSQKFNMFSRWIVFKTFLVYTRYNLYYICNRIFKFWKN